MDFGPNNWYPEPVPMWNLQTPTIFVPPSPTLVNPPLSPPPHFSSHPIPPFQSPAFIPNHAAVQSCINAFAVFQQGMNEASNDFRENMQKIQESFQQSRRLIRELRTTVPTASAASYNGPQYAPEDPTLPSPWRGLIDGSTGSVYYWNTATNQTQYEKPCPLTHPPLAHPTQPIYLQRKQLRVLRRRVSMAATRRLFKATRKPDLLSTVGKAPGTQVNCKKGLWAIKAQNGYLFSEIMEEIRQLCVGTPNPANTWEPPATNPSSSTLNFDASEHDEDPYSRLPSALVDEPEKLRQSLSVTVADELSLTLPSLNSEVLVPNKIQPNLSVSVLSDLMLQFGTLPSTTFWSLTSGIEGNLDIYETPAGRVTVHTEHDSLGAIVVSVAENVYEGYSSEMIEFDVFVVKRSISVSTTRGGKFKLLGSHDVITTFFTSALQQSGHEGFSKPVNPTRGKVCVVPATHLLNMLLVSNASCMITLKDVFQKLPSNSVLSWTSILEPCAHQGYMVDALMLFSLMEAKVITANNFTLLGVSTACRHSVIVEDGRKHLENMLKAYSFVPGVQHYACLVDPFGQAGCLWETMTIGTTPTEQLSKHKLSLNVSEVILASHMLEVTKMEFVLRLLHGVQILLDWLIKVLQSKDLVKATASGEFLVTSGKTHIQVHALTTLLLEFERYMNFEIITFELLADDYCYWKRSLPLSARFENIQWSAAQMLGADELPKLLPTYMTTSICVVAADTLLVYEILTGVLGSYNRVLAVHMGLFLLLHTSSIAIVPFMVIIVLVSTWPNQDHSLIPLIGAAYVKRKGALSRLQAVVHPRNLSLIHHIPHLNVTTECVPGLVLVICGVYYDTHFASKMEILIANHDLNFEDAKSSNKLAMALAVVEIQTKGTKALHQLHPHNDILPILLQVYSFPHDLRSQKHEHELDFLSILYMDHAPSLLVPTMFISHVTGTTSVSIINKMVLHGTTLLVQISDTTFTSDNFNSANEVSYDNQQLGNNLSEFYACEHHTVSSYQGFLVPLVVRYSHKEKKIHHTVSSTPILLMYAGDVNSVVQLNFQAWLFLLNLHERGPAKNRVFPNSPSFMRVTRLFALKLILLLLLAMVFRVTSVVLKRVIPATKLVHLKYKKVAVHAISHFAIFCVASVFMYLQLAEEFFPSQILESLGLYMAKKEIPTTWIWLATTRLCLQVWELNLHGMNLITAQMLIGDALFMRELMIADACDIIPTGDIGVRLVGHCGADVSLTNSYSLMHHSPLFWLLIKVMSPQSHTTYTWANYPVASYEFLFVLRNITSELSMVYSSSWGFPQPTIADYMKQVFARTISTCGCCTDRDEIKFMLLVPRVGHKADCLGILPLLYKLVFAMASLGTLVLHVTIVSVILGDYASRYTTVVIYMVTTPCFAELVMGVSTTLVLCVQNATRHTLSVPTQKTAQVLLFRASGDGNLLMHIGQEMQMVYAEVSTVELDVSFNNLSYLPTNIGYELVNLQKLSIQLNKIRSLPTSVCELRSLRSLDAHFNELRGLPLSFGRLTNLQTLNLASNFTDLTELPDTFGDLTNLKELDLSNNQLHELPVTFGRLDSLTKLNLDGNPLVFPPPEIVQQGVEAVKLCMARRWLEILVEEERKSMLQVEEEAETGWLTRSTSWLTRSLSGVSGYLSPRSPRDPALDQQY